MTGSLRAGSIIVQMQTREGHASLSQKNKCTIYTSKGESCDERISIMIRATVRDSPKNLTDVCIVDDAVRDC